MARTDRDERTFEADPLWYKEAIIYQLHVRSFFDSNADGVGDFPGLTQKLDYIQDLGVTAVWILPFYPSPLKDDGYDIADYTAINASYGEMADLRTFIREAHRRGLRVITELVMNHTSDRHAWFQRARRAPAGSRHRDHYVWSDRADKYTGVRIIFTDAETSNWAWDPVANAYYWHRFYTHQPDLNFESPDVQRAMLRVVDFWFGLGVDGLRLDAIPYLYEREGTSCENLPETHGFLKKLRQHVDAKHAGKMLLAEANQWPDDAVAYFGDGDECHAAFHFPVMPRLFMALRMEDRYPIIEILEQTPDIPETCQWTIFLRNHDELTLEMVTDEDRDYMYRVYAQDKQARVNLGIRRRLAPLLGNARRRIELMNGLLFSLPGTPIVYYGDEIGMGDNIYQGDRNAVRTPMQWNGDRNAGFSHGNPQQLFLPVIIDPEYHYETVNVEAQQANPHSLLWWMKRIMALRKRYKAFGRGTLEFVQPENRQVIAFLRRYEDECVLVIANLSRFVQPVELDLAELEGGVPIEMFGHTEFPPIGVLPYFVTLGPHSFYWFTIEQPAVKDDLHPVDTLATLKVRGSWGTLLAGKPKESLEAVLPDYVKARRWFGGKARRVSRATIVDAVPVGAKGEEAYVALIDVSYSAHETETYVLPLAFASGADADALLAASPQAAVARVVTAEGEGILYDATWYEAFTRALVRAMGGSRRFSSRRGRLAATSTRAFGKLRSPDAEGRPEVMQVEQSNTSIVFGERFILKLMRRPEPGVNPDLEIGRFLTEQRFEHVPPIAGALQYVPPRGEPLTLAILQGFVRNEGNAWEYTLDALGGYFERVLGLDPDEILGAPQPSPLRFSAEDIDERKADLIGPYLESARLLGQRTAELHVALATSEDPDFVPEPMSEFHRRGLYQSLRSLANKNFQLLRKQTKQLSGDVADLAEQALALEHAAQERFRALLERPVGGKRIRCHGDYHLGQVLFTGKDFVIVDFEGEPARSLGERRLKRPALRDVAGMLRSFHYAAYAALQQHRERGFAEEGDTALERWAKSWYTWVSAAYLSEYLTTDGIAELMPSDRGHLDLLLDAFLLEKAIYEIGYELNNRPEWLHIPLAGMVQILGVGE